LLITLGIMSMFLARCGDLRHPRSFPTRRSSDLGLEGRRQLAGPREKVFAAVDVERGQDGGRGQRVRRIGVPVEELDAARREDLLDWKSTRLNSSHVKISYAVFCLKKKINLEKLR